MATNDSQTPGTERDDTLVGTGNADTLTGATGSDQITGSDGNDVLSGDGPIDGAWHFEVYDRDFSGSADQAFDIESGTLAGRGYVTDFNVRTLTNSVRGTTNNPSDYGIIYTSNLNVIDAGTYRFDTRSDDGSTIQIFDSNGDPVTWDNDTGNDGDFMDNDFHQGATTRGGTVTLDPNETYTIQIRYWENGGGEVLSATVSGPGTGGTQDLLTSPLIGPAPGPDYTATALSPLAEDEGNDTIDGGAGDDAISGDGGDDSLFGGGDDDQISGGDGNDTIFGDSGAAAGGGAVESSCIGHWTFDDTSDPLDDDSANDNNAILQHGATYDAASGAVELDGTNDFIEIPHDPAYDLQSATIVLDFNLDSLPASGHRYGLVSRDSTNFDGGGHLTAWVYDDGSIELRWQSDSADYFATTPAGVISDNTDHSFQITFDQDNQTIELFVDGASVGDLSGVPVTLEGNSEPWVLGANQWVSGDGVANNTLDYLDGAISEFKIYDGAFTPDDLIPGPGGDDDIDGGDGSDVIFGEDGNDTIDGGADNDTISGGEDDDVLTGGDGDDVFTYESGDGADTITDFNFGNSDPLGDGDTTNNDFVDLSNFYDHLTELRADFDDDGILNQSNSIDNGGTVDYSDNDQFQPGDSLTFQGIDRTELTDDNTGVVCFTPGIRIMTDKGLIPVELIREGDLVQTADNGFKPVIWVGRKDLSATDLERMPHLKPVLIQPCSVFGNTKPLRLSPQHRLVLQGSALGDLHQHNKAFVRAKLLTNITGSRARIAHGTRGVSYIHIMTEAHEVVFAEGIESETFWPGPEALRALHPDERREIFALFPTLEDAIETEQVAAHYGDMAHFDVLRRHLPQLGRFLM